MRDRAVNYNNPLVKIIPFKNPIPFRRIAIAYRKSTVRMEAIEKFVLALKDIPLTTKWGCLYGN